MSVQVSESDQIKQVTGVEICSKAVNTSTIGLNTDAARIHVQ